MPVAAIGSEIGNWKSSFLPDPPLAPLANTPRNLPHFSSHTHVKTGFAMSTFTGPAATSTTSSTASEDGRGSRSVVVSAWAVPIMVLGQFAFLAAIPVAIMVTKTFRDTKSRALRWWVGSLGAVYAVPFLLWTLNPNRAESLSKDIHPVFVGLIVAASAALLLKIHTRRWR